MNQEIGITFKTVGLQTVEGDINRLGSIMDKLHSKLGSLNSGFSGIGRSTGDLTGKISGLSSAMGRMGSQIRTAKGEIQGLATAVKSVNSLKLAGSGGPFGGGKSLERGLFGSLGAAGFMLRYKAYTAALEGAKYGLVDIGMGRARSDIDQSLGKLSGLGFDKQQKYQAELASARFASRFGHTSQKDYVEAMTYTASSFDTNKLGMDNITKMNESAILMGKAGQMGTTEAAKFQNKMINQIITALPAAQYEALTRGGKTNLKGFGGTDAQGRHLSANMNMGELSQKLMAMTAQSHATSGIFGKETMAFMSQFGPIGQSLGMNPSTSLALAGVLFDSGQHPGRSGRGMKALGTGKLPEALAKTDMLAEGRLWKGATGRRKQQQDAEVLRRSAAIQRGVGANFWEEMLKHTKSMDVALKMAKGKDGLSFTKTTGMSNDFISLYQSMLKEGFLKRGQDNDKSIANMSPGEVARRQAEQIDSIGNTWDQLVKSSGRLEKALSQSSGELAVFTKGLTNATNRLSASIERENQTKMMGDFLNKKHKEAGWGAKLKGGQERWGENADRKAINKWAQTEYKNLMGPLGKRPKDDDPKQVGWDMRQQSIFDRTQRQANEMFSNATGKLTIADITTGLSLFAPATAKAVHALDVFTGALTQHSQMKAKPEMVPYRARPNVDDHHPGGEGAKRDFLDHSSAGTSAAPPPAPIHINLSMDSQVIKSVVVDTLNEQAQTRGDRYGSR